MMGPGRGSVSALACRSAYSVSLYDPNYQDLVVLDPITESVLVYANSPDFLSQTAPTVVLSPSLENPRSIAVADMDASGTQDLIVGMEGGFVIFFNSGTFPGFSSDNNMTVDLAGSEAMQIVTGDFDVGMETGPGTIDVALVNASTNQLEIYFQGDGGTGFASSRSYSIPLISPVRWADAGDINHDGMCDILVGTADGNLIVILPERRGRILRFQQDRVRLS